MDSFVINASTTRVALANVPGFGPSRDVYALAFRDAQGRLAVESYEYANDGSLARRGVTVDPQAAPNDRTSDASIRISAYREGGVMIASQRSPNVATQRLSAWALDPSGTSSAITPNRVTSQLFVEDGLHGMCRVPNDAAEGDFLVATGRSGVEGIRLRAFRSGPRQ